MSKQKKSVLSWHQIVLLLVLLTGFFLRIVNINHNPARLTHDEMSIGYNAYSVLKTGQDEWSRGFPLDFEAFGDHKLPGAIYTVIPSIAIFGLNTLGLKLPSILAGTLLIYLVYKLVLILLEDKNTALFGSILVAASPWTIHFSRMMLESNLALTIFTAGVYFSVLAIKKKKTIFYVLAGLLFGASFYFYIAYRLISLLVLALVIIYGLITQRIENKKHALIGLASLILILLPLLPALFSQGGTARFQQVSFLNDTGVKSKVQEMHNYCFMNLADKAPVASKICRKVLNKPLWLLMTFLDQYSQLILPTFIFVTGEPLKYLSNPDFGQFFIILMPLYFLGMLRLTKSNSLIKTIIIGLFLIAPLPSALTGEPQIVRASAFILPLILIMTLGWSLMMKQVQSQVVRKRVKIMLLSIYLVWFSAYILNDHFVYAPQAAEQYYELPQEAITQMDQLKSNYDFVYIDDQFPDAHIALAFFQQIDPQWYQQKIVRPNPDEVGFSHPTHLGRYRFGDSLLESFFCNEQTPTNVLYVTRNYQHLDPTYQFKDFSGVHTHAQLFDLNELRQQTKEKKIKKICQ
jgi:4-amino-4-deoxy-L-arabinose transferase-like glycosyltransferase